MSFLPGIISGSLVAGGIYYAIFSEPLLTRTLAHQRDLKLLDSRLQEPRVHGSPSAADRIHHNPRKAMLMQRWNEEIEGLFHTVRRLDRTLVDWGRRLIGDKGSQ
ncbi:hypothetical protein JB92DRAFT_2924656 [Gautieria morchelliformis]|nr:hypothetical protein JB92DRAFT_2924656 [Gautieria morchelliformis]